MLEWVEGREVCSYIMIHPVCQLASLKLRRRRGIDLSSESSPDLMLAFKVSLHIALCWVAYRSYS